MPIPAYVDTSLYLPLGGVNGFEVNGFDVNGVGLVDSPFAGVEFRLDPYRSVLSLDRSEVDMVAIFPTLLNPESFVSVQRGETLEAEVWAARGESTVDSERNETELAATQMALVNEVESISVVRTEYRTSYVLASHPASLSEDRAISDVDKLPLSYEPDTVDVSVVPAEDRTTKVRRI